MLAFEQDNIAGMKSGQDLESPLVRSGTIRQSSSELGALSDSQRKALREVLESHDRVTGLQGVAGSGKTTTLRAIRNAAEREGYAVEGFAPTSRAAHRLEEAGMRTAHLDQIVRQRDPELKQIVESLANGNTDDAVQRLTEQQRVHEIPDTDQRLKTVAGEYLKDPDTSLVVSPDNQSRLAINRHIHESLQAQGRIGSQDHTLTILVNRHELTGADREWADRYDPWDVEQLRQNSRHRRSGRHAHLRSSVPQKCTPARWAEVSTSADASRKMHL